MRSALPSTALRSSCATGEFASASSRASRPRALPEAYCSQQPRLPHSHRWPPGMMIWWPNSPATPNLPRSTRPSITMAPPMPVPRVMQTSRSCPCPAPKRHSAQAAASASLTSMTGRRSRCCRFSRSGSFRQARCGLNSTVPPSRSIQPAAPMPTDLIRAPAAQFLNQFHDDPLHRTRVASRRGPPRLAQDPALGVHHAGGNLGAANVDADGKSPAAAAAGAAGTVRWPANWPPYPAAARRDLDCRETARRDAHPRGWPLRMESRGGAGCSFGGEGCIVPHSRCRRRRRRR